MIILSITLAACTSTSNHKGNNKETQLSEGYGYSAANPILIGAFTKRDRSHITYFSKLRGPKGEPVKVERLGSCCQVESTKAMFGDYILLDKYILKYSGQQEPTIIYVNMYDSGKLDAPKGFTLAN